MKTEIKADKQWNKKQNEAEKLNSVDMSSTQQSDVY